MGSDESPEVPGELVVGHWVGVVIVRDDVADALRAAADWMDQHQEMVVDGVTVERHNSSGHNETNEIRFFVRFR